MVDILADPLPLPEWHLCLADSTTCCGCETIAKLTSSNCSPGSKVSSAVSGSDLSALAVDNHLVLFSDRNACSKLFRSAIDCIALLPEGVVAVAEVSGAVTVGVVEKVGVAINFTEKNSCNLVPADRRLVDCAFYRILFQVCDVERCTCQIVCLTSKGFLLVFSNIRLIENDVDLSGVAVGTITTHQDQTLDVAACKDRLVTVGYGKDCLSVYTVNDKGQVQLEDSCSLGEGVQLQRVEWLSDGEAILTSDVKGTFYLWDSLTLVAIHSWSLPDVLDFRVVESQTDQFFRLENIKMNVLRGRQVQTLNLSSLKASFEQSVSGHVKLSSAFVPNQDDIYVTESSVIDDEDDQETIVAFRCYAEINPQRRLQRLIALKRFEEAQELATLYSLDCDLTPMIVQTSMWRSQATFQEMEDHLQQCDDRLKKCNMTDDFVLELRAELFNLRARLTSFHHVFGQASYSPSEWTKFQSGNPFALFFHLLVSDHEKAFRLWSCFKIVLQNELKPGKLCRILRLMPKTVPWKSLQAWLCQDIIPFIARKDVDAVKSVIQWTEDQVNSLELNNESDWSALAMELCESVLKSLHSAITSSPDSMWDPNTCICMAEINEEVILAPLHALMTLLVQHQNLKTKYGCYLSLHTLQQETRESIVFRMLDKVAVLNNLLSVIQNQVLPYVRHEGLTADSIFAKYVKELLLGSKHRRVQSGCVWEEKVKVIINVITDPKEKIVAILNLLECMPLPIPEFVENLVHGVIDCVKHPLIATLKETWTMREAGNIMVIYGLKPCKVDTYQVKQIAKFILSQDEPSSLKHAQKFLSAHKVEYTAELAVFQGRLMVERNKVDDLTTFLKTLPGRTAQKCCDFIVTTAENLVADTDSFLFQSMCELRLQYCRAAQRAASVWLLLNDDPLEKLEMKDRAANLKNAYDLEVGILNNSLEVEYSIFSGRFRNCGLGEKVAVFKTFIGTELNKTKLFRLARLLGLRENEVVMSLLAAAAKDGRSHTPASLLRRVGETFGALRSAVSHDICDQAYVLHDKRTSPWAVLRICNALPACCDEDELPFCIELCKLAGIVMETYAHCQNNDPRLACHKQLWQWWGSEGFHESSLPLTSPTLLSELSEALFTGNEESTKANAWTKVAPVVETIYRSGHVDLALRVVLAVSSSSLPQTSAVEVSCQKDDDVDDHSEARDAVADCVKKFSSTLLSKVLNSSPVDAKLALPLILAVPTAQRMQLLKAAITSCGTKHKRLKHVSAVALTVAEILKDQKLIESCERVKKIVKWVVRLQKIGLTPFKSVLHCNVSEAVAVVDSLVESPHCQADILQEFCSDFDVYPDQLDGHLLRLFDTHIRTATASGMSPESIRRAQEVLLRVRDQSSVTAALKDSLKKTSAYNYEVLEYLLQELFAREESEEITKNLQLLTHLRVYTRTSPPTEMERTAEAAGTFDLCAGQEGEELSRRRLNFHFLVKNHHWEVIRGEISSGTLDMWLQMAPLLSISTDDLTVMAARKMTQAYIEANETSASSSEKVSEEFLGLLSGVNRILSRIDNAEISMWFCHSMVDKLKHVGEKVVALQGCVKYTQRWHDSTSEPAIKSKAQKVLATFSNKLTVLSTQWAMVKSRVPDVARFNQLLKKPEELILKLHSLPCLVDSPPAGSGESRPDINELCDKIADLHTLDLTQLRMSLLDQWLLGSPLDGDADQTMTFDVVGGGDTSQLEDEDLKRCTYVMTSRDREECLNHVAAIVTLHEGVVSLTKQRRGIFCLLRIATEAEIVQFLNKSRDELRQEFLVVCQLCGLESLGVTMSTDVFLEGDKALLVASLLANHQHQREAVALISALCIEYEIYNEDIWCSILQQLIKFNLVRSLEDAVSSLCHVQSLRRLPLFLEAWSVVSGLDNL